MYRTKTANLDDWQNILDMLELVNKSRSTFHSNARKNVDFSPRTMESYLVRSLTSPVESLWLLYHDESPNKVLGFMFIVQGTMPDFKVPVKGPVPMGFIASLFVDQGIPADAFIQKTKGWCMARGVRYVYANVKVTGAYKHFIENYGAEELHRTLFLKPEDM